MPEKAAARKLGGRIEDFGTLTPVAVHGDVPNTSTGSTRPRGPGRDRVQHPEAKGFGGPNGIRTRVLALRGLRPRPLDDGAFRGRRSRNYSQRGESKRAVEPSLGSWSKLNEPRRGPSDPATRPCGASRSTCGDPPRRASRP